MKTESGIILPDNYQFYVKSTELEIIIIHRSFMVEKVNVKHISKKQ